MRNKKKRVIASILAISILFQFMLSPMTAQASLPGDGVINTNTSWFSRLLSFGSTNQTETKKLTYDEQWDLNFINFLYNSRNLVQQKNITFENKMTVADIINIRKMTKPTIETEPVSTWDKLKELILGMIFSPFSQIPLFLLGLVITGVVNWWQRIQTAKEIELSQVERQAISPVDLIHDVEKALDETLVGQPNAKAKLPGVAMIAVDKSECMAASSTAGVEKDYNVTVLHLYGYSGTGKSLGAITLSRAMNYPYYLLNVSSDIDPNSRKTLLEQLFDPIVVAKIGNSMGQEESALLNFLMTTNGYGRTLIINEIDKMSQKDRKMLLEIIRTLKDTGQIRLADGRVFRLRGNLFIIFTSNFETSAMTDDQSIGSRVISIEFEKFKKEDYLKLFIKPLARLQFDLIKDYNMRVYFENTLQDLAQSLAERDGGARIVETRFGELRTKLIKLFAENVKLGKNGPFFVNVSYDGENDDFIIKETEAPSNMDEENLDLLSENEDDENLYLSENDDDEDSNLSEGSGDEETHADAEKLSLLSENEDDDKEDSNLSEDSGDEGTLEENTEQESPASANDEAAVNQKESDNFNDAMKSLDDILSVGDDDVPKI